MQNTLAIFEDFEIRRVYDEKRNKEGHEPVTKCHLLKLQTEDGTKSIDSK